MDTNFIFFGICLFGGMVIGALLTYGAISDAFNEHMDKVFEQNNYLIRENNRLKATLARLVPDKSLWGFTKGDRV